VFVCVLLSCFFFFQAEDGIRDFHVTGVQTCALPIWPATWVARSTTCGCNAVFHPCPWTCCAPTHPPERAASSPWAWTSTPDMPRSEERRVGKECRSRWSPDQ